MYSYNTFSPNLVSIGRQIEFSSPPPPLLLSQLDATIRIVRIEISPRDISQRRLTGYCISSCNAAVFCERNEARYLCTHNGSKNVDTKREIAMHLYLQRVSALHPVQTCSKVDNRDEKNEIWKKIPSILPLHSIHSE